MPSVPVRLPLKVPDGVNVPVDVIVFVLALVPYDTLPAGVYPAFPDGVSVLETKTDRLFAALFLTVTVPADPVNDALTEPVGVNDPVELIVSDAYEILPSGVYPVFPLGTVVVPVTSIVLEDAETDTLPCVPVKDEDTLPEGVNAPVDVIVFELAVLP